MRTFRAGLERVQTGVARFRLALMCAEKDPLECHRTILVCRQFRNDMDIRHILSDGSLETHADAENRLLAEEKVPGDDMFTPHEELIAKAYDRRGGKIAYHECGEPAVFTREPANNAGPIPITDGGQAATGNGAASAHPCPSDCVVDCDTRRA